MSASVGRRLLIAAVVTAAACGGDVASAPVVDTGKGTSPPQAPQSPAPTVSFVNVFSDEPWWAGSPYPDAALLVVYANGVRAAGIRVGWSATNGGTVDSRCASVTDNNGVATCPNWTLGGGGIDSLTATVGPWPGDTTTYRFSFADTALARPAQITEYQLVLVNGEPPDSGKYVEQDVIGGLLRLGSDGTFEWVEVDSDLGTQYGFSGMGQYALHDTSVVFSPSPNPRESPFPGLSGTVARDTITVSFVKQISVGLDPEFVLRVETYVRTPSASIDVLRARRGR